MIEFISGILFAIVGWCIYDVIRELRLRRRQIIESARWTTPPTKDTYRALVFESSAYLDEFGNEIDNGG